MKTSHIFALVIVAVAAVLIMSLANNTSEYVGFQQAYAMAVDGNQSKVHVIGQLTRDTQGRVTGLEYEPSLDPNYLGFQLVDEKGQQRKVVCYNPPSSMQDFERSEKVVVIGQVKGETFVADKILMKCPSKYEETKVQ